MTINPEYSRPRLARPIHWRSSPICNRDHGHGGP